MRNFDWRTGIRPRLGLFPKMHVNLSNLPQGCRLAIIRTNKRIEAHRLFGDCDPRSLSSVFSKVRPTGIDCYWQFSEKEGPWIIAVKPDEGFTWTTAIEAITAKTSEIPSQQRYGLSSPAAALFDWLRKLPASEFELGLSPICRIRSSLPKSVLKFLGAKRIRCSIFVSYRRK